MRRPATSSTRRGVVPVLAWAVLAIGSVGPAGRAAGAQPSRGDSKPVHLAPTATCPQADTDDLARVVTFVRGQSWAQEPGSSGFEIMPDTTTCRVVLRIDHLTPEERSALATGAGSRLVIQNVKDYRRPSRLPLFLWVILGGSGLIWLYRRTGS